MNRNLGFNQVFETTANRNKLASLRILVRRTLQRWKYPPDNREGAIELVLKQAEALSDRWSAPS